MDAEQKTEDAEYKQIGELLMQIGAMQDQLKKIKSESEYYKIYLEHVPRQTLAQEGIAAALEKIADKGALVPAAVRVEE